MRHQPVLTSSAVASLAMIKKLTPSQPLGLIHGPAGAGKTTAVQLICSEHSDACYIRAKLIWRSRSMTPILTDLLDCINRCWGAEWHSTQFLYRSLLEQLASRPNTLLVVDEADYLVKGANHDLLDLLRDLADQARIRIVFTSINSLARLLTSTASGFLEAVTSRIGGVVEFRRASIADGVLLARDLLEGVSLERDVVNYFLRAANGSLRVLLGLFEQLERHANAAKINIVTLEHCADFKMMPAAPAKEPSSSSDVSFRRAKVA